jgi:hypothetical protein
MPVGCDLLRPLMNKAYQPCFPACSPHRNSTNFMSFIPAKKPARVRSAAGFGYFASRRSTVRSCLAPLSIVLERYCLAVAGFSSSGRWSSRLVIKRE